jgi:hypothetical protein
VTDPRLTKDDLGMMQQPQYWANWPYQTIKQRSYEIGELPKCALLVDISGRRGAPPDIRLIGTELGLVTAKDIERAKQSPPVDVAKLFADGWVID